jgi:uncharacterized repeat protein (TIGR03803 family)
VAGSFVQATDGNLYGTTNGGGDAVQGGAAFQITPSGTVAVLHQFPSGVVASSEGGPPGGALIQATDGDLYGTTLYGGPLFYGTVFKLTTTGTLTVLHAFSPSSEGYGSTRLIQGSDGNLYGTTTGGGPSYYGTAFKLTTTGTMTVLHVFSPLIDGYVPAGLVQPRHGTVCGKTSSGGASGTGRFSRSPRPERGRFSTRSAAVPTAANPRLA